MVGYKSTSLPTYLVIIAIYSGFALVTWFYQQLPLWLSLPCGAYLLAWHNSLQHEVIHGHPTRWRWLNSTLVFPNLSLWLPYWIYRDTHLRHHRNEMLTDPSHDPESFYISLGNWQKLSAYQQYVLWFNNTLLGRLLIGPGLVIGRFFYREAVNFYRQRSQYKYLRAWLLHISACFLVLIWVIWICEIPLFDYLMFFIYPALSLTLLRSFLEHQAAHSSAHRSAIVDAHPIFALLYLNNNLHAIHHNKPGLPWYQLGNYWRQYRDDVLDGNSDYYYDGYSAIFTRFLLWAKEKPFHSG